MAKKFVRGITDVKNINNQDYDTNNVNDLLSDGQYNYIHRKKGKNEEYHNLTDNIKTLSSDNTELLSVTNYNKTTNTATLHPKHDAQKEQLLESTRDTISINHGENGTAEKTTVDTNPQKVLEHENLMAGDGLNVSHEGETSSITISPTKKSTSTNLNNQLSSLIYGSRLIGRPTEADTAAAGYITIQISDNQRVQFSVRPSAIKPSLIIMFYRFVNADSSATEWRQLAIDGNELTEKIAQKQDVLTAGEGITIQGNTISATGGAPVSGASVSIQDFSSPTLDIYAIKHVITIGQKILTTFSFECYTETAEHVISGELKEELKKFIGPGYSVSNGALVISHEDDVIKLLNTMPERHSLEQATFTFYSGAPTPGGGSGV